MVNQVGPFLHRTSPLKHNDNALKCPDSFSNYAHSEREIKIKPTGKTHKNTCKILHVQNFLLIFVQPTQV